MRHVMNALIWVVRIALGLLFIFSGLVKANDPMGLVYKMNEIFEVWDMNWLAQYSFALSVGMIWFEIVAGVAMIVGNAFRFWISMMVLINIFYTFLTWYAWTSGKVKECGCFGACIKISNSATFYKDLALTVMSIFLFIFRYRVFTIFQKPAVNASVVGAAAVFAIVFQWYTLHYLPVNDCLAYKPGNNLWEKMHDAPDAKEATYNTVLTYEKNGLKKDFTTEEYTAQKIWQDKKWKFVENKTTLIAEGSGQAEIPRDFAFNGMDGKDYTEAVLTAKGYTFLWFVRDPSKVDSGQIRKIRNIVDKSNAMHVNFYVLISIGEDSVINTYKKDIWNIKDVTFYMLDGVVSKTAMRTDPGLMLLNDGNVLKKWSYMNYPKDVVMDNGVLTAK